MAVVVAVVAVVEQLRPLYRGKRPWWSAPSELVNAVVFVLLSAGRTALLSWLVLSVLVPFLRAHHLPLPPQPLATAPLALQFVVHFVVVDALDYGVHRLLHGPFWLFHRVHHSVRDDEMRALVSFRFHAVEIAVYTVLQAAPLLVLAVDPRVALAVGTVQLALGVLAHANVDVGRGVVGRVIVTPAFHRWHHAHDDDGAPSNFGHCFAWWDWLCGTARLPPSPPTRLGHAGDEAIVPHALGHQLWPLLQRSAQQRKPVE
jgi:sterol desaturase/sphingolipid hydroxylase (fatty acid hydroxylase superfamily)